MNNTKKLLVKLTPYETFFFGGERTFGEGNVNYNYFVKSEYFPQQTTLLGFVRYQLLSQSNNGIFRKNKIINERKAIELIGKESFDVNKKFKFGVIKNLSPVFIADNNNYYLFTANREYQWINKRKPEKDKNGNLINIKETKEFKFIDFTKNKNGKCRRTSFKEFIPYADNYDPKLGLNDILINRYFIKKLYDYNPKNKTDSENGIFIKDRQVGIKKNYEGKTDEKDYFVHVYLKLLEDYSFAFILELDANAMFGSKETVTMGCEQSKFKMDVLEIKKEFDELLPNYKSSSTLHKVVLISDTYFENTLLKECLFSISDTISFRFLKTSVSKTKNYAAMSRDNKDKSKTGKSGKYELYKKGSVFYFDDEDKAVNFVEKLKDYDNFYQIGYNHSKFVKKN